MTSAATGLAALLQGVLPGVLPALALAALAGTGPLPGNDGSPRAAASTVAGVGLRVTARPSAQPDLRGLAPGDTIDWVATATATTTTTAVLTATVRAGRHSALTTDATAGLRVSIQRCPTPWTAAPTGGYRCPTPTEPLLRPQPIALAPHTRWTQRLSTDTPLHLLVRLSLPRHAANDLAALHDTVTVTFTTAAPTAPTPRPPVTAGPLPLTGLGLALLAATGTLLLAAGAGAVAVGAGRRSRP